MCGHCHNNMHNCVGDLHLDLVEEYNMM